MQNGPLPPQPRQPTVFISSQHPACSSSVFKHHWGRSPPYSNYLGPLEIIRHLRPACSVFVPHDLDMPIRPDELTYMSMFDIYCAPSPKVNPVLRRSCRVVPAGWVKHNLFDDLGEDMKARVATGGVFFLNQVVDLMRAGGAGFVRAHYPRICSGELPVKLPAWPGCNQLGDDLRQMGATVIATETPSTKLIAASPRIYVNAPGSVIAEAWHVGTPVILAGESGHPDRPLTPVQTVPASSTFDFDGLLTAIANHIEDSP